MKTDLKRDAAELEAAPVCDVCGGAVDEVSRRASSGTCMKCGRNQLYAERVMTIHAGAPALNARHVRIKIQLFQRDELARRVDALDAMIAAQVRDVAPDWMSPEDAMIAIRALKFDGLDAEREAAMIARSGAALRALDEQSEAAELEPSPSEAAPDDELDPNEEARAAAFQAAERELAALDEPMEGETWRAFHERAALEIIAHYTSGGAEEDTREELREAIDHIVKAADEAAAERGAATVKRVEELLAAHHVQIGRALEMMKRAAVQEALSILNTATGAAVSALTAQDPAVD